MADLDFTVNANTTQAQRNLQQLEGRVNGLGEVFGRLKGAIAGLVAASTVKGLFDMSNALADLSATTNISIQSIAGLGEALAQNSGSFDQANNAVLRFTETLGSAFEGSAKTQEAFAKIGVSLQDLRTLSEQDLLRKTILGLGQVADTGTRASLTAELFGKSLRGADLAGVARDLDQITSQQREFAIAAEKAGAVNQSFQNSFRSFQQQLLIALEPLSELARSLTENTEKVRNFIAVTLEILKFAGIAALLLTFGKAIMAIGSAGFAAYRVMSLLGISIAGLFRALRTPLTKDNLIKNLEMLPGIGNQASGMLRAMGVPLEFLKNNFGKLTTAVGGAIGAFFGLKKVNEERPLREMDKELDNITRQFDELTAQGQERRRVEENINTSYLRQQQTLKDSLVNYSRSNELNQRRLRQEIDLIGLTEQQQTMKSAFFELEDNYLREVTRLTDLYAEKSRSSKEEDRRLLPEIQAALKAVTEEYQSQISPVMALTQEKLKALEVEKQRLELEKQRQSIEDFAARTRIDNEQRLRDLQDDIAKSTMTEIQRKYYDIARAAEDSARRAVEAENSRRAALGVSEMSIEEVQRYYQVAFEGVDRLMQKTAEHQRQSRSWSAGWRRAMNEYVDNATNAARRAENIFKKATQGMEDAFVKFAKTGRFEWRGFLNSLAEELLRSQVQQLMAQLFGGGRSGGSVTGAVLGSLFGTRANGGSVMKNRPYLVGERGPEVIVPDASGSVIPNSQLGGATVVNYNISAVDAPSFRQMIARDPTFLYAVTEQGRRRLPGGR